jgi:chromosome segregation protein
MEFKKIQLNGFKSFADKTNFLIEDGLTELLDPMVVENQTSLSL